LPLYYILEWRNAHGFDRGLLYTYQTVYDTDATSTTTGEWRVERVASNVPGMIVWLRDTRYGNEPFNANNSILDDKFLDMPSEGPKGGLLVIDSHPEPLRGPLGGTFETAYGTYPFPPLNNWSGRVQTTNSAIGLQNTPSLRLTVTNAATTIFTPTTYAPLPPVSLYDDGLGYFPGVEELPEPIKTLSNTTVLRLKPYAFSDPDASAVVPAKKYYPPRTPPGFTGRGAETSPPSASVSTFETLVWPSEGTTLTSIGEAGGMDISGQQSGNPRDYGAQYGYHFRVAGKTTDGSSGVIEIWLGFPGYIPIARR
jgi:hypothetical protein